MRSSCSTRDNVQLRSLGLPLATVLLGSFLGGSGAMRAQSLPAAGISAPAPRVLGDWRGSAGVAIAHSKPTMNPAAMDLGPAPGNQALGRMLLLLAPAPAQQQALAAELASLENPSSPSYHHWLTPQAFAQSYANNASDVAAVADWLESQGFTVAPLPAGLGWIEFSGTVAQVEQAFGTQVDMVSVSGSTRAVLTTDITVPGALSPVIAGLVSLDGVLSMPALTVPQPLTVSAADLRSLTSPANAPAFTPYLAAQLLDATPLTAQGVNGAGQTIAIVSRSNINGADVAAFRSAFALPASPLQISLNGPDPGLAPNLINDQAEATLAASWAGAAAPGAQILLVSAATTSATDGVDLSLAAIVDQDLANVVAVGYSACEAALSPAHQSFYSSLYQQAAAEGITVIAAVGDGGAAACTPAGGTVPVNTGLAVNALASTPWNTAVGVAAYGAGGAAAGTSALTAWSPVNPADPAYASGGGSSTLYARMIWQPVPAELATAGSAATRNRFLPDLALPTALDSSVNPGLAFCLSGSAAASGCTLVRSGGSGMATAFFAGVAALINQKNGVQGNLAPSLYATSRISGVFSDVAQGTAKLACVPGSSGCDANSQIGYAAGSGYDLATGLGVPDVQQLVNQLVTSSITIGTLNFALSLTPTQTSNTYNPSAPVTFTVTVTDTTGTSVPTGSVAVSNSNTYNNFTPVATLAPSGSASSNATWTIAPSNLYNYAGTGSYNLGINYAVNGNPSMGTGYLTTITSAVSPTVLSLMPSTTSPALGSNITVTVTLSIVATGPPAGAVPPSGAITLTVNGTALNPVPLTAAGSVWNAVITVPITATSNSIVASYPGDSNYGPTTANPYILTASKAATTITLTASSTTVQPGMPVTLTATVAPVVTPASGIEQNPSGTVLFYSGATQIGSASLSAGPGANSSTATLTVSTLPNGSNSITAVYQGDTTYSTSTSTAVAVSVAKAATSVVLTASSTTVLPGMPVTLTATVTPVVTPASGVEQNPSGTVVFYNGTTAIGSAALSPGPGVNSSTATIIATLPNGSDSITAVYEGDTTYATSTSTALIVNVARAATNVVLTANNTTVGPGQAVIFTATVTPQVAPLSSTEQNPSGTVLFYNGTMLLGSAILTPVPLTNSSTATFISDTLPGGSNSITAVYLGDTTYAGATSNPLIILVQGFTLTACSSNPPTNLNITKGGAGTECFVITSVGGFAGLVQVICTVPTQDDMTCAISPQQVTPTATATFVVETYITGGPAYASLGKPSRPGPLWPQAAGGAMLAGLVFFLLPFGRRARMFLRPFARKAPQRFIVLLMLLAGLAATGIGCTGTTTSTTVTDTGTPLGVATLEVIATAYVDNAVVAQTLNFTVNVQPQ